MTVCVAALAARSRAIVCVADKSLSYGDYIQWDTDSSKMVRLNNDTAVVLFAGNERDTSEVLARFLAVEDKFVTNKANVKKVMEQESKQAIDFLVERLYLSPRQLSRQEYISAISGEKINDYIATIAKEIHTFSLECSLIVCGSEGTDMFLLELNGNGIVTDMTTTGFHAVGSGSGEATSRLLYSEHKRNHNIERVLYDVFDAKANAELTPTVGYEWDAWVVLPGRLGVHEVPKEEKEILENAWSKHTRSPFDKFNPKEDRKGPPKDWKERLQKYSESVIMARASGPKE